MLSLCTIQTLRPKKRGMPFNGLVWTSIDTMAPRDLQTKWKTFALAHATFQIWFRSLVPIGAPKCPSRRPSCLCSMKKAIVPIDANFSAYRLSRNFTPTCRRGTDDLDGKPTLNTYTSPSFFSITSDKIRLSQNDNDFCCTICGRLGKGKEFLSRLTANASCIAPSKILSKW